MMKISGEIHEFNPIIYPCRIWVAINPSYESISEKFYAVTTEMERMDIEPRQFEADYFSIASTCPVTIKQGGWIGLLVCIWKPKSLNVDTICHESVHCSDFICEQFGITNGSFDNGEAYAYLTGWIAGCIESVKKGTVSHRSPLNEK